VVADIESFLGKPTPVAWVDAALDSLPEIVIDHANCEKKAAATAMSLLNRYPDHDGIVRRMSPLAREELRHFEQVVRLMKRAGIRWRHVGASRYAAGLRETVAHSEPDKLVDLLIIGAFIEARSCERFALLAPRIGAPFDDFYRGLLASEARHFSDYLSLARASSGARPEARLNERIDRIRSVENRLAVDPDTQVRFHSGPPA
jgi:tRNA-(ms[2]io[6]A)-hydroxylase